MEEPAEALPEETEEDPQVAIKKVKPPNKKRFEEELEQLSSRIRDLENELKKLQPSQKGDIASKRSEKIEIINTLKTIDTEIRALTADVTKRRAALDRLQSNLVYKNEKKIDDAVGKLEYQLKRTNFKLSEEKKIVAEIDKLQRSKKVLVQYVAQKKEMDDVRERQRQLREERDRLQKVVNRIRMEEDSIRRSNHDRKLKLDQVKRELDELHEIKRRMVQDYKASEKEYQDVKQEEIKVKRQEGLIKKQERRNTMESFQQDLEVYGTARKPFEDEVNLCNTLINYLKKFNTAADETIDDTEPSPRASGWSLIKAAISNELEDGKYVLLKKDEDEEFPDRRLRRCKRPSKKGRKQSVMKSLTHPPQIFSQFASLNLNAPSNISEIPASLEQLHARKKYYEDGAQIKLRVYTPSVEENSDGGVSTSDGISATESAMCEMSRQASHTESMENASGTDQCLDELVRMSETLSEKSEYTTERSSSDSTVRSSDSDHSGHSVREISRESRDSENMAAASVPLAESLVVGQRSIDSLTDDCFQPNDLVTKQTVGHICDSNIVPPVKIEDSDIKLVEGATCGNVVLGAGEMMSAS
ncbi:DNA ligase 1-like isoform X2 [Saccostrea echinata]|uniref:DNA ligase 1-like isoform X2 n=1 Tax=Saccostrea echinata TaxID=191078 RepID=UPI002A823574|nr:DNA ligase 1-like isoform X2 [Saccostrea echinata]